MCGVNSFAYFHESCALCHSLCAADVTSDGRFANRWWGERPHEPRAEIIQFRSGHSRTRFKLAGSVFENRPTPYSSRRWRCPGEKLDRVFETRSIHTSQGRYCLGGISNKI